VVTVLQQQLGVSPERARELASEDALLALELAGREPTHAHALARVALARQLSRQLLEDAKSAGPPTESEVEQLTRARWWELDRPRMVAVTHAVVMSENENLEAEALARKIAEAVQNTASASEFENTVKLLPTGTYTVRVETLPPVTRDGRAVDPDRPPPAGPPETHFAAEFAEAALALDHVGQLSPVVRSPFGYHVMRADRIIEPKQPSLHERMQLLGPEVLQRRALAEQAQLLERQRRESPPEEARSARRAMARVAVQP
jgi:parvulin-like peptidyl-prolyl isomerase